MPVNLARLSANRASAAIDFGDAGTLHVEFYPARITVAMLLSFSAVNTYDASAPPAEAQAAMDKMLTLLRSPIATLVTLLAGWDLTETADDGGEQTVPLDEAHIAALGIQVQWAILGGVLAQQQGSASGEASASAGGVSAPTSDATSPATAL